MKPTTRWTCQVYFDTQEVHIDAVRVLDGVTYPVFENGELGDSRGTGVVSYDSRDTAVEVAKRQVRAFTTKMLALCK